MGILRSDRVSGLGGANAINGSAHFQGGDGSNDTAWIKYIDAGVSEDYNFGTGDFTVECWLNRKATSNDDTIWGSTLAEASSGFTWYFNGSGNLRAYVGGSEKTSTSNSISVGTWYHVAITRASGTMQMWVDGVSKYSATVSGTVGSSTQNFIIGNSYIGYTGTNYHFLGHISNLRIQKGKAEYTAAFTPSTTRLKVTPETVLLACHDPGNVLAEATGKTLALVKSGTVGSTSAGIVASRFVPDVGEDYGTTFEDNTKFDTLSYMVPPGGTRDASNRGRTVFGLGNAPSNVNNIEYVQIQSDGNAVDFGDLITAQTAGGACASSTRGIFGGGQISGKTNVISYVTIATTSNATDYGDLSVVRDFVGGLSNSTRGLFLGGRIEPASANSDTVDYITIATTGDATDFGNLQSIRHGGAGCASPTRGLFGGGSPPSGGMNTIDYFTIASTGDGTDYGDLSVARVQPASLSSSTRGIWSGGTTPSNSDVIDYVTIASTGSATDFGNLTVARRGHGAATNSLRGIFNSGEASPGNVNTIDYVTIATTGNATDFGDCTLARLNNAGCSDSHGGIS